MSDWSLCAPRCWQRSCEGKCQKWLIHETDYVAQVGMTRGIMDTSNGRSPSLLFHYKEWLVDYGSLDTVATASALPKVIRVTATIVTLGLIFWVK